MFKKQMQFARRHVILTAFHHFVAGVGLAVVFQHYLFGNAFLPIALGWLMVTFSIVVHVYEWNQ